MAVVTANTTVGDDEYIVLEWEGLGNGDTGDAVRLSRHADKTVQVDGTFSTGGTVVLEGSQDDSNWFTLTDPQGNDISFTAAGMKAVMENPKHIRPNVTAGDGSTDLNVRLGASTLWS